MTCRLYWQLDQANDADDLTLCVTDRILSAWSIGEEPTWFSRWGKEEKKKLGENNKKKMKTTKKRRSNRVFWPLLLTPSWTRRTSSTTPDETLRWDSIKNLSIEQPRKYIEKCIRRLKMGRRPDCEMICLQRRNGWVGGGDLFLCWSKLLLLLGHASFVALYLSGRAWTHSPSSP